MSDKIYYRDNISTFTVGFFSDAIKSVPVIPYNSDYPKYTIYNQFGVEILSGVGTSSTGAGYWQAQIIIDEQNSVTSPDERYKIYWTMVNSNNQQFNYEHDFELQDNIITESEDREQKYVVMAGSTARLKITLDIIPDELSLRVFEDMNQQTPILSVEKNDIKVMKSGGQYVFYADMSGDITQINKKYSIVWKIRRTPVDTEQFTFQIMTAIGSYTLNLITSVRMLIDKFQKRLGTTQAYEDSDIVEYLERGMELLNSHYPMTNFQIGYSHVSLNVFHIMLSSWYALNAQQLLETDLGFNFSSQSVTLDYDHSSQLSDVMSKWKEYIDQQLTQAKYQILNQSGSVGTSAGRGTRYTQTMTWKVASYGTNGQMSPNSLMGQLNTLGLLW